MASTLEVLRALGINIDPAELMAAADGIATTVRVIDERLQTIERQQGEILSLLNRLAQPKG